MAIVAVQQPRAQKDSLDRILQGLQIAQGIFGIKTAFEQSDLRKLQEEQLKATAERADEAAKLEREKFQFQKEKYGADKTKEVEQRKFEEQKNLNDDLLSFSRDKKTKDLIDSYDRATQVEKLVGLKNPIADQIAKRNLFRISGDVGVIREQDLKDLGGDPSLQQRAVLALETLGAGNPITDKAREDIYRAVAILKQVKQKELNNWAYQQSKFIAGKYRSFNQEDVINYINIEDQLLKSEIENEQISKNIQQGIGAPMSQGLVPQQQGGFFSNLLNFAPNRQPLPIAPGYQQPQQQQQNIKMGIMGAGPEKPLTTLDEVNRYLDKKQ